MENQKPEFCPYLNGIPIIQSNAKDRTNHGHGTVLATVRHRDDMVWEQHDVQ